MKFTAYVDKSDGEFSLHCLDETDLEVMLSAMKEQQNKANLYKGHIVPLQKKILFNLIKIINDELNDN